MPPVIDLEERVRYSETDQMGVAHNKAYFEWFELGRTEFCRRRGLAYREIEAQGFYLVVVEAHCRYRRPLRYDQEFIIRTSLRESTPKKFVFDYALLMKEDGTLAAEGSTIHIVTNRNSQVVTLPDPLRLRIAGD